MTNIDLKKSLEKIKSINWKKKFKNVDESIFEEINQIYFSIFPFFLIPSQLYNTEQFNGNYYRVRPYKEIKNHHSFSEYSYPPHEFVKNQRANIKNHPVLYLSLHPKTSVLEYIVNQKDDSYNELLSLSVWNVNCDRDIRVINLLNEKTTKGATSFLGLHNTQSFKEYTESNFNTKDSKYLIELYQYFINSFCVKNDHIFSSYIAHKYLYTNEHQVDVLIYPSLAQDNTSINLAFNKSFSDKYLNLKRVYVINSFKKEVESPTIYGDVKFFKDNEFEKEMILDSYTKMYSLLNIDFGDSII